MAPVRRFFAPGPALPEALLDDHESAYLLRVLRLRPGTEVEVFDGAGRAFGARFLGRDASGRAQLALGGARRVCEPRFRLTVAVATPKGDGFTRIARQLAELGAHRLVPLVTTRSEGHATASRRRRWRSAALSGTRQSGGARIPEVAPPMSFAEFLSSALPPARWIADPGAPAAMRRFEADEPEEPDRAVAVGPEGGFAPDEVESARAAGFLPLGLGPRVLRTGTAAIVAAARLLELTGPPR